MSLSIGKTNELLNCISSYGIQSNGIVRFTPGDLISVYLKTQNTITAKDIITMVEITTTN